MTKIFNENNLSYLTGALAFLLFSTYFICIILYGRPRVPGPFVLAGIGLFFCCVIIYRIKKYPVKKIALAIGTGVLASLLVLIIAVLIGTSLVNDLSLTSPAGAVPGALAYDHTITLDVPLPASPATAPLYRVVSVQQFSTGTGTALTMKKQIPATGEAPGLAEKALEKYGGLPADAVLERTEQVFMKKYNIKTGTVEEQYPQYTQVIYRQYVNGSPVINSEISVSLGENGELLDISKDWSTLEPAGEVPVISTEEAMEKLKNGDLLFRLQCCLGGYHITRVQSGYYVETHLPDASARPVPPDTCTPVWIFYGIKPGNDSAPFPLLVNATRG